MNLIFVDRMMTTECTIDSDPRFVIPMIEIREVHFRDRNLELESHFRR